MDRHDERTRFAGLCEFEALAGWDDDDRRYPAGFRRDGVCVRCGCTEHRPCRDGVQGCHWVFPGVCSRCADRPDRKRFRRRRLGPEAAKARRAYWREDRRLWRQWRGEGL